ncbi:cysteine dioxygenase family protein [Streptantibioticus cattleyicolor]|uniref:Cysteine dioxygenase type I n=1 Tax=Streptantibioticus cattleyicolor (strain ATCC 35852 / DSM 46488 / JCM 4925 / NBRC 14057 / NRRL 8057) TaxID=1003195 RepID=F8JJ16_STREN|nr:cysteine dioxygenase family protein [Streptantibioticus cattleyicolor]AEW98891.1 cysteine dioxygenase type I [Streptantibioticus cattleyicolor NRRL 8057 = DSM 46488]CCB72062.1 Predicted metal-dependent enzyme of the double-stranded beta helix superfamily [Streptantibioticus cattleyicolor NRRL 8057 = DSM 46488]
MTTSTASGAVAARTTERIEALVAGVREVVRRGLPPESTAHLVAELLAPLLGRAGLLTAEQCEGDPERYRQHVLHSEPDGSFSLVALVWLPGQSTSVHDHVSWCVTGVHEGQEHERRYRLLTDGRTSWLARAGDVVNGVGEVAAFAPPGDIHRVRNGGPGKAISLHVYGADVARLGSSIRRVYQVPEGER